MYEVNFPGPPTPPFRHVRGGQRKKSGCLGFWSAIDIKQKIILFGLLLGITLSCGCVSWFWLVPVIKPMVAPAPPPTATPFPTAVAPALEPAQLTALAQLAAPPAQAGPPPAPAATLTISQVQATATFIAQINRPAGNPANSPNYVGVITYETGCSVSNLGFTTAGLNGAPYYLYFSWLLDRDPNMQMAQIKGYVQKFDTCQYPVIMVSDIYWLNQNATPAPLAYGGAASGGGTITATAVITQNPATWGKQIFHTPTPTYTIYIQPQKNIDPPSTPTLWPTYTPYPTYTPQPAQEIVKTVIPLIPTYTPYPTATPNPAANVTGRVVNVAGCVLSNLAVETSPGVYFYIILAGAALPASGQPTDYHAMVSGVLDTVCGGQAIRANSIAWYSVTPTPTCTPTATPTATPTETATITSTEVITP